MDTHDQTSWIDVLGVGELSSLKPKVVRHEGKQIAIFLSGEKVYACNNRCPHEGYPLSEGTLSDGCVLTCNWHNWKFDLEDGATLVGGDRLRRYPAKIETGRVYIDVSEPTTDSIVKQSIEDLLNSFDDHAYDQMAREIARIMKAGGDPIDSIRATIHHTYERFEYGMTHALAVSADWLHMYELNEGDDARKLTAVTEIVAYHAWDTQRQKIYPYAQKSCEFNAEAFVAAIENEDEALAIAHVRGALSAGACFDDFYESLVRAALAHYQDFGHSLIYVVKARSFVKAIGNDVLEPVLLMLVRSLVYASREDLIPEFKAYAPALESSGDGTRSLSIEVLKRGGVAPVLNEISASGDDHLHCYELLLEAASWQMLHMDLSYSLATSGPVQNNVGWLDFTHALTFANAVHHVCTDFPDLWPAGLLQIGCFLGRNGKFVDPDYNAESWRVDDPLTFATDMRDGAFDHGQFEYIVAAHILKLSHALVEEISLSPDATWTHTAAAALNRFLNSPLKRKHPLRTANQALEMVSREG